MNAGLEVRDAIRGDLAALGWLRVAMAVGAIAAVALLWQHTAPAAPVPGVTLPVVTNATSVDCKDAVVVGLARGGRILVRAGEADGGWAQVSLNGLADYLAAGRGVPRPALGRRPILLHADRDVPWSHVQLLLTTCAEGYLANVRFAATSAEGRNLALDATLPVRNRPQPEEFTFRVRADKDGSTGFQVLSEGGDILLESSGPLDLVLDDARHMAALAGVGLSGQIKAARDVPHQVVVELLATLRARGLSDVDFYGTAVPDAALRAALTLPEPKDPGGSPPEDPGPGR